MIAQQKAMGRLLKMLKYHIMKRNIKFSTILEDTRNEKIIRSVTNIFDRTILQNSANNIFSKIVEITGRKLLGLTNSAAQR